MRSQPGFLATTSGMCSERGVAADLGLADRRYYAVEIFPHDRNPVHESPIRFLFARNPLIANPALPYVGLMLFGRAGQSVRVLHPSANRYQSGNVSVTIGQ